MNTVIDILIYTYSQFSHDHTERNTSVWYIYFITYIEENLVLFVGSVKKFLSEYASHTTRCIWLFDYKCDLNRCFCDGKEFWSIVHRLINKRYLYKDEVLTLIWKLPTSTYFIDFSSKTAMAAQFVAVCIRAAGIRTLVSMLLGNAVGILERFEWWRLVPVLQQNMFVKYWHPIGNNNYYFTSIAIEWIHMDFLELHAALIRSRIEQCCPRAISGRTSDGNVVKASDGHPD